MFYNIYLDNASTSFPSKKVLNCLTNLNYYYNASNLYTIQLQKDIEDVRKKIMNKFNKNIGTIIFTSGACEANTTILRSVILQNYKANKVPHIITSSIEHHSVLSCLEYYEKLKLCEVSYIKPNKKGIIPPEAVELAVRPNTVLIHIIHGNNETGSENNLEALSSIANKIGILCAYDCTQTLGKIPIISGDCDFLTFSGHKFGGPKGVGGFYCKDKTLIEPLIYGGNQEFGLRAGTYNSPSIIAMGVALEEVHNDSNIALKGLCILKRYASNLLKEMFQDDLIINGDEYSSLPVLNFSLKGIVGEAASMQLADKGIFVSNGSACNTGDLRPSYVLTEMGISEDSANEAIRISFNINNTLEEIEIFCKELNKIYKQYKGE